VKSFLFFLMGSLLLSYAIASEPSQLSIAKVVADELTDASGQVHTLKCGLGSSGPSYIALNAAPGTWGVSLAKRVQINDNEECEKLKKFLSDNTGQGASVNLEILNDKLIDFRGVTQFGLEFSKNGLVVVKGEGECFSSSIELITHTGMVHLLRCEIGHFAPVEIALDAREGTWGVLSAKKIKIKSLSECERLKKHILDSNSPTVIQFSDEGLLSFANL
jgi:hypothetical protein